MLTLSITTDGTIITINGLLTANGSAFANVDTGNGELITSVTAKVTKGCEMCSNCEDSTYINEFQITVLTSTSNYTTDNSGQLILNSTTFLQTTGTNTAALDDNVYHIDFYIDLIDADEVIIEDQKYSLCIFTDNNFKCKLIKIIQDNPNNDDLVNIYNALTYSSDCKNCCKLCELYSLLIDSLNNQPNCKTC